MKRYNVPRIAEGVHSVGVRDWARRTIGGQFPAPDGTTYNSYLVLGRKKRALVDTVRAGFEDELLARINQLTDIADLDYVVMDHAAPDHSDAVSAVLEAAPKALLVTSLPGAKVAQGLYHVPEQRLLYVKEGTTLDLGGAALGFIEAPSLPSPETMFTYHMQEKVLFSGGFFASHTAYGICDEDVPELHRLSKRYFATTLLPFRESGQKALQRLGGMDIRVIAPCHGPVYKNPKKATGAYVPWTNGDTEEKALVAYLSLSPSITSLAGSLEEALASEGIEVRMHDLAALDAGELAADLLDARAVVLGSPAVLGGMHPLALQVATLIRALRPPARLGALLGCGEWAGAGLKSVARALLPMLHIAGTVETPGPPGDKDHQAVSELACALANRIRESK